jgi:hypothetical protein
MNLVQINERLKDLPESVIRQYANGMNPEVPSYLALGELQRREMAQKRMAATQGGAQGPQPSVKEQIEQKAGLMALQQMQQQQMAQQQAQPRGPMPAPAGVPQPQQQPEVMMAARGGLARIPVRSDMFEYAGGGIVAFASGGEVDSARANAKAARERLMSYGLAQRKSDPEGFAAAQQEAQAAASRLQAVEAAYAQEMGGSEATRPVQVTGMPTAPRPPARPAATAEFKQQPVSEAQATMKAGPQAAVPVSGVKAAAEVKAPPRPPMAPPATPQGGLPTALPARSPYFAQVNADLAKPIAAPTPEGIIAEQRALSPEAMQEEFMKKRMEEQRQRAAGERAAFEKTRPSGLDDLIRVFGQAGQYKGLSGLAPAYTANKQQQRAEELAMEQRQNQLLTGIDKSEYEGGKELFGARTGAMKDANKSFQDRLKSRSEVLAQMAGVDQRAIDEALNRLNAMQIAQLRTAAEARPSEAERIEATYMGLIAQNKPKEAEEFLQRISRIKRGGDKEDTLGKEIAKKRVEAAALPAGKYKDQVLAGLAALEKGQGGGAAAQTGKVVDFNSLPK